MKTVAFTHTIALTWTCYLTSGRWSGPHNVRPSATRCSAGPLTVQLDQIDEIGEHGRGVDALLAAVAPWETEGAFLVVGERIELPRTGAVIPWDAVVAATPQAAGYVHAGDAHPEVLHLLPGPVRERGRDAGRWAH